MEFPTRLSDALGRNNLGISEILGLNTEHYMIRDNAIGTATGYGLNARGGQSLSPCRGKIFLYSTASRSVVGPTQPPIQWVPWVLFPEGKAAGE
jgi:hypothetical protein